MSTRSSLSLPRRLAYGAWRAVPGPVRGAGETALRWRAERSVSGQPWFDGSTPHRLLIGPLNTAGQAQAWARAADRLPDVQALSLSAARRSAAASTFGYATDVHLDLPAQLRGMRPHRERVLGTPAHRPGTRGWSGRGATLVVSESGRPVLGDFWAATVLDDLPALEAAGVGHAVLLHGSEVRDPDRHAERHPHSPFRAEAGGGIGDVEGLRATVRATRELLERYATSGGGVLVSTPDLLDDVPAATLLPVMVDVERFSGAAQGSAAARLLERARPVVLHAPSKPWLKGTAVIEDVLAELQAAGRIEHRRLSGVPHARMAEVLADADVVVDQVVLGNPGVLLAESLAAGRLVVAHLSPEVRDRMAAADRELGGDGVVPVVEADAGTLRGVLEEMLEDRARFVELAGHGPAWATRHHDGTRSAAVLRQLLG